MRLTDRLAALETNEAADMRRPLPTVLPDTATDAELDAQRRRGEEVFRESDTALHDLFI